MPSNLIYIDEEVKALQKKRVKDLGEFLSLDYETFDNLLDINPRSTLSFCSIVTS
jgi:hypothetical protein